MKEWIDWKYRKRRAKQWTPRMLPDDVVFSKEKFGIREASNIPKEEQKQHQPNPEMIYRNVVAEFNALLRTLQLDERKEGMLRRKITLHSLRRHAKTVLSNQVSQDYSEWFLGHSKSPYWTMKESQRRQIYAGKCMKYLTFLDYSTLETVGKNIEAKLEEKDREIAHLVDRDIDKEDTIKHLSDQYFELLKEVRELKKRRK